MNPQVPFRHDGSLADLELPPIHGDGGVPLKPSDAVVNVFAGDTPLVTAGVAVIQTDGTAAYTWTGGEIVQILQKVPILHLKADWTLTVSGEDHLRRRYYDVVEVELITGVTDTVLASRDRNVDERRRRQSGVATGAGSTDTILIDKGRLLRYEPNSLCGSIVRFTAGSFTGQTRTVAEYDPVAAALTFTDALPGTITESLDCYELAWSWEPQIRAAWQAIYTLLTRRLDRHDAVRLADGEDLREAHIYKSLANVWDLIASGDDSSAAGKHAAKLQGRFDEAITQAFLAITTPSEEAGDPEGPGLTTRTAIRRWGR